MSIKDKIKEAFSKGKSIKIRSKWDEDSQPNIYALDVFLRKSGYKLVDILEHKTGYELVIEPVEKGYMHPDIVHDFVEKQFSAIVPEHGELLASDLESIIQGYETALGVLNHLDNLDFSKLELDN